MTASISSNEPLKSGCLVKSCGDVFDLLLLMRNSSVREDDSRYIISFAGETCKGTW